MTGLEGPTSDWRSVPFDEAIAYFRDKVRLPTDAWTDLWEGMHARAFVVAGARNDAMLADFQDAIGRALRDGTTLDQFRKDFDAIVARYGWSYKGGRNWRSRVIFETNLNQAQNAGRWAQAQRLKDRRPFLRYVHRTIDNPRLDHKSWHNVVLPVDDPWWDTHMPMNGWGCKCMVQSLSEEGVARLRREGEKIQTVAPPVQWETRTVNTPRGPRSVRTPKGIDPGFGANPGRAAFGGAPRGADTFVRLEAPGEAPSPPPPLAARPLIGAFAPDAPLPTDAAGMRAAFTAALGGEERIVRDPFGSAIAIAISIGLADALPVGSPLVRLFPLLPELVEAADEVWAGFYAAPDGRVILRRRFVSLRLILGKAFGFVLDADARQLVRFTAYAPDEAFSAERAGLLLQRRPGPAG